MSPTDLQVWTLNSQLVEAIVEMVEPLGGRALLEEVGQSHVKHGPLLVPTQSPHFPDW